MRSDDKGLFIFSEAPETGERIEAKEGVIMGETYKILDFTYRYGESEQHVYPVVLLGERETVLIDCGYPGSLEMLELQLKGHNIKPESITALVLTHQDDDHMGAAAEIKEAYPAIQVLASAKEEPYISGRRKNLRLRQAEELPERLPDGEKALGAQFCERLRSVRAVTPDGALSAGDQFDWGGGCEILDTPGHTPGHISIRALNNEFMITGDAAVFADRALTIANPEFCLDLEEAQKSLEKLIQYQSCRYICYHGGGFQGADDNRRL